MTAVYYAPTQILHINSDTSVFAIRLLFGVILLLAGLAVRKLVGTFLMIVGLTTLVLVSPFVFQHFGSIGALLIVFLALALLIGVTIRLHRKGRING